jgi:arsenite methyltransferase
MVGAGFLGIHLIKSSPWQVIDGIHFFSVTLTGYKLPVSAAPSAGRYATLRGPFSRVVDELGTTYLRGIPQPLTPDAVSLLSQTPLVSHFILSSAPLWLDRADDRWTAIYPAEAPCFWQGHFAMLAGPFVEAVDDDHHMYRRGEPVEICSKTLTVLETDGYAPHFAIINRAGQSVNGNAVTCSPNKSCC